MARDSVPVASVLAALGVRDAVTASPVSGGGDTSVWHVERGHEEFALRLFPAGQDAVCARELAVLEWAGAHGIPVPRVHTSTAWQERQAMLLSWCRGQTFKELVEARPWQAEGLGTIFGETLAAIHTVTAPEVLLRSEAWRDWKGPLDAEVARALQRLE
jgi:aminoglycoside phosphotransferase (APT) family kinase protein